MDTVRELAIKQVEAKGITATADAVNCWLAGYRYGLEHSKIEEDKDDTRADDSD